MSSVALDTHSFVKTLTAAGMPEAQAEAVTALIKEAHDAELGTLATKTDLADARTGLGRDIAELRAELQRDLAELKTELQRDLAETKADTLKWLIGLIGGAVVINAMTIIGAMPALVHIIAH